MVLRVYVDFNTAGMDEAERVLINTALFEGLAAQLRPGLPIVLHDETLEVTAVAGFDERDGRWWATPDWSTSRDLPWHEHGVEQRVQTSR